MRLPFFPGGRGNPLPHKEKSGNNNEDDKDIHRTSPFFLRYQLLAPQALGNIWLNRECA